MKKISYLVLMAMLSVQCGKETQKLAIAEEFITDDEPAIQKKLVDLLVGNLEKKYANVETKRDAHPKSHGCVKAELSVIPSLSSELQVGIFAMEQKFPMWIRYSTASGSVESDIQKENLGMAMKVMGVPGEKILEGEKVSSTQDFLMISSPRESIGTAENFMKLIDAALQDKPMTFFFNPFDLHIKEFIAIVSSKRHHANPLEDRYWSTVPYLFGKGRAIKYSAKPCLPPKTEIPNEKTENYLRETMVRHLEKEEACFDFMVQFQTDTIAMPLEDSLVEWSEDASPFLKVAQIHIPIQKFDSPEQNAFCENLSFTPWHSLPEFRPLGNINRARKVVYEAISKFRHEKNKVIRSEPTGTENF